MIVPPRELERVRHQAAVHARDMSPEDGWRVDAVTAGEIVALFPRLSVRAGLQLVTFAARCGAGGNGWTFALPESTALPAADDLDRVSRFPPQRPAGALAHAMDAIDGDGGLHSHVEASILRRELGELGAWWHGIEWRTHALLENGMAPNAPRACSMTDDTLDPGSDDAQWRWEAAPPQDWRPRVRRRETTTEVTFFTTSAIGQHRICRHVDIYERGSLRASHSELSTLASGPAGFVF